MSRLALLSLRELMDDNCVFNFFYSMSSETAVTFTGGHFNQAVFAVMHHLAVLVFQHYNSL